MPPKRTAQRWLVKSEPFKYSFQDLVRDGKTTWDGVRNFEARSNLGKMKKGDLCLFYHSNEGKAVVGIARVRREGFPDPTADADEGDWVAVEVEPVKALHRAVGLEEIKANKALANMTMLRRQRLSVVPVTVEEFETVVELGKKAT